MPIIKPVSGHTGCAGVRRYLIRQDRALGADYLNLDTENMPQEREARVAFDWAARMDVDRHEAGNDLPWQGRPARTYKHYIFSPDPQDALDLGSLREVALAWTRENFGDYEVALIYHDDNEGRIPHAHIVVNNTNLVTGSRLQDPDPRALKRSAQALARARGMRCLEDPPEHDRLGNRVTAVRPKTMQQTYVRRAEAELAAKGQYSWVADIRDRVSIARSVATSPVEFESVLASLGIAVDENSPKAARRDWLYSFADHPSRRISGEKLGLSYGKAAILARIGSDAARLSETDGREIIRIARDAVTVDDLDELHTVAAMVQVNEQQHVHCLDDYDRAIALLARNPVTPKLVRQIAGIEAARETAARLDVMPQHANAPDPQEQGRTRRRAEPCGDRIRRETHAEQRRQEHARQPRQPDRERRDEAR